MKRIEIEKMETIKGGNAPYTPDCAEIFEFIFTENDQAYWLEMFFYLNCHTSDWNP